MADRQEAFFLLLLQSSHGLPDGNFWEELVPNILSISLI